MHVAGGISLVSENSSSERLCVFVCRCRLRSLLEIDISIERNDRERERERGVFDGPGNGKRALTDREDKRERGGPLSR